MQQLLGSISENVTIKISLGNGFYMSVTCSEDGLHLPWENSDVYGVVCAEDNADASRGHTMRHLSSEYSYDYTASLERAKNLWIGATAPEGPKKDALAAQMVEDDYRKLLDFMGERWTIMNVNIAANHEILGKIYADENRLIAIDHNENADLVASVKEAKGAFQDFIKSRKGRKELKAMFETKKAEIDKAIATL